MLGMIFATLASVLWIGTVLYATGYMRGLEEHNQTRFFAAFAASLSTAIGIAFGENLLTVFIFYELLSLATYPLVVHDESDEARAAGRKYLAYTFFGGGVLVLAGTALVYALAGTLTFGETAAGLATADPLLAQLGFAVLVLGFGTKAAIMPFHSWLPDAMVAPTPVSGLLHAVAVVKSGAFGVARVVLDVYEPQLTADRASEGSPEAATGLFHHQPVIIYYPGNRPVDAIRHYWRPAAYPGTRIHETHTVLLRGRYPCRNAHGLHQ